MSQNQKSKPFTDEELDSIKILSQHEQWKEGERMYNKLLKDEEWSKMYDGLWLMVSRNGVEFYSVKESHLVSSLVYCKFQPFVIHHTFKS